MLFVGGAADKESFLWGNVTLPFIDKWPHYTVKKLARYFNNKLKRAVTARYFDCSASTVQFSYEQSYQFEYLSYTEIFFESLRNIAPKQNKQITIEDDHFARIRNNIGDNTHVYIVGHSLGGWNCAHLSYLLSTQGIRVAGLITLDPVGTGNHDVPFSGTVIKQAQIYKYDPIPVADVWFNVQALHVSVIEKKLSKVWDDWVAWAGGQWLIDQQFDSVHQQFNIITDYSHIQVNEMFNEPSAMGESASSWLLKQILARWEI